MANLEQSISIGTGSLPLYQITVNDTDPNAEFGNFSFTISHGGTNGGLTVANLESAVQAFVDSVVASHSTFVQGTIKKINMVETAL